MYVRIIYKPYTPLAGCLLSTATNIKNGDRSCLFHLHGCAAVLRLHRGVPVDPELSHEPLQHSEKATLFKEPRLREGGEPGGAEGGPVCGKNDDKDKR